MDHAWVLLLIRSALSRRLLLIFSMTGAAVNGVWERSGVMPGEDDLLEIGVRLQ